MVPQAINLILSFLSTISTFISCFRFIILVFFYIFLFFFALWLLVSLYCYVIEVVIWFIVDRHSRRSPGRLIEIMIPDPYIRFRLKIAAGEASIWLSALIYKFRRVSDVRQRLSMEELPILLPEISYKTSEMQSNSNDCAICLDDFIDEEMCRVFPVCNHIFHSQCIDQWTKHRLSCPICRNPVVDV